jgi:hypothetical protein
MVSAVATTMDGVLHIPMQFSSSSSPSSLAVVDSDELHQTSIEATAHARGGQCVAAYYSVQQSMTSMASSTPQGSRI